MPARAKAAPGAAPLVRALRSSALFAGLAEKSLSRLAAAVEPHSLPGGRALFHEGDEARDVFVVVAGRLRAWTGTEEGRTELGEIGPGEVVGETALLTRGRRTATVHAIRDCELLRLSAERFEEVVAAHPELLMPIASVLAERSARPAAPMAPIRTVAIVGAGTERAPLTAFVRMLAPALERWGTVAILTGAAEQRGSGHLHEAEARHRFVLYQSDGRISDWTSRCLRHADLVLLVGRGGTDPALSKVESVAFGSNDGVSHARRELVLVWGSRGPRGTMAWMGPRSVAAHHHVVDGSDIRRLARRIAGRAIGVVLGGGGARGFAHLGVMRALDEARIPVDFIGGTSIGAIMAGTAAMGWDDATRVQKAVDAFVNTRGLVGPTLPIVSFSSSKKISRLLSDRNYFGDKRIEDLRTRFFCVSANLSSNETVVHETGLLWLACRASASLPGVLPPVYVDGDLLVDGGVVSDVPVRQMRTLMDGTVIASDISVDVDLRVAAPIEPILSGWKVLGRKLNPLRPKIDVPNAVEVIMRAKEIGGRRAQLDDLAAQPADITLRPPTGAIGALDFKAGCDLIETAYRYAAAELASSALASSLAE